MRYRLKERVLPGILAARPLTAGHEAGWVRALGRRASQASASPVMRSVGHPGCSASAGLLHALPVCAGIAAGRAARPRRLRAHCADFALARPAIRG